MEMETTEKRLNKKLFFKDLGYAPHPGQQEVHNSDAMRRVMACGVRWGKTLCAAMEGLCAAMEPRKRSMGWVVGPTYDLCDKVFRELVILVAEHLRHRIVALKEGERRLVLRNMGGGLSEIRGKSEDNPVSLLGEGLDWLIVDEASRLKPTIWEGHLSQRLIDKRGWALLISTPKGKGYFYDLFRRGQSEDPDYESWNHPSWSNPYLDVELIEQERDRLPERVFNQEFGGQFLEGSGQVFRNIRECATGDWQDPIPGQEYFAGLDLAKVEDYTVLVIMNENREVVFVDRFNRLDWHLQIQRIKAASTKYNQARVFCDSTGAGEPIYESLRAEDCLVEAYPFTMKSKTALIDNLCMLFEKGEIVIPRPDLWPEGIDEFEAFQYSVTDSGNVRSGAASSYHDDIVV
ncbi:MAG: hypothetical protein KJ831_16560, partial [Candidatus Eisenbacteria bacterium]|nr:hypothetical protein [Candidatus Eisenbacteria bacterium]